MMLGFTPFSMQCVKNKSSWRTAIGVRKFTWGPVVKNFVTPSASAVLAAAAIQRECGASRVQTATWAPTMIDAMESMNDAVSHLLLPPRVPLRYFVSLWKSGGIR